MRLSKKTAFVTAAGQGIGRATAEAFAREGAQVIAADINASALADLAKATGCTTIELDVTNPQAVAGAAERHRSIDILFNVRRCGFDPGV
jgi:2-keto-3-deoxy-L-fuconate dehydrogenase